MTDKYFCMQQGEELNTVMIEILFLDLLSFGKLEELQGLHRDPNQKL